jgi:branched-chain amino acid transport system permease protein
MVFGLAETFVPLIPHVGPGYTNAIAFALLVLVLIFRPRGLLGKAFYS